METELNIFCKIQAKSPCLLPSDSSLTTLIAVMIMFSILVHFLLYFPFKSVSLFLFSVEPIAFSCSVFLLLDLAGVHFTSVSFLLEHMN